MPPTEETFCWMPSREEGWSDRVKHLVRFLDLIVQWEGCPDLLKETRMKSADWSGEDFEFLQREAAYYYTQMFVSKFGRLPIVPVPYAES